MEQYDRATGGTGAGGANTPSFGSDLGGMRTAPDHQIPDETSPSHGAAGTSGTGTATAAGSPQGTEQLRERATEMAGRAEETLNQGMKQAAERIDGLANRLDQVADERLGGGTGATARAGEVAHSVADTLESVAGYLRNHDTQALRGDLERQMRDRPLQTLMVAVAAGWLVGKIVR